MNENNQKTKVLIDTRPLANANAIRGVGVYTRLLTQYLGKEEAIEVYRSGLKESENLKPDIIHYPFFDLFFDTLPLKKKAKTVVTVHDVIPLVFPEYYQPGIKGKLRFLKQKTALQKVDAIITDSLASKKDIIKYLQVKEDKVHVVYLAANPELQHVDDKAVEKIKRKYKLPKNYILYVGDINYNKNIPQLIKSLYYLPNNIKLVCVGKNFLPQDIPEWQWIESQIAAGQLEKRVKFLTEILGDANEDLSAIYSGALAYVHPSLYEGFGLPVLEAMQCKTLVVCSRNSSLIEVGDEYVKYAEPEARKIADGVNEILALSKEKKEEMIKAAYMWSQSFSWEKTVRETANVYQAIL